MREYRNQIIKILALLLIIVLIMALLHSLLFDSIESFTKNLVVFFIPSGLSMLFTYQHNAKKIRALQDVSSEGAVVGEISQSFKGENLIGKFELIRERLAEEFVVEGVNKELGLIKFRNKFGWFGYPVGARLVVGFDEEMTAYAFPFNATGTKSSQKVLDKVAKLMGQV